MIQSRVRLDSAYSSILSLIYETRPGPKVEITDRQVKTEKDVNGRENLGKIS